LTSLVGLLREAADVGFLGGRDVEDHIDHALGFAAAAEDVVPTDCVDLGSGAGVPGLVLAVEAWPQSSWSLVEAMGKRAAFLHRAVAELGVADRVRVVVGRAEDLIRHGELARASADLVTSRGFGAPPLVAEAAAPFLRVGGSLVVSEPPGSAGSRWPAEGVGEIGLRLERVVTGVGTYAVFRQIRLCPDRFPRATKAQRRSPLFHVEQVPGQDA
jgi:16S rRNA (guanine527-N7)-methyltransferase